MGSFLNSIHLRTDDFQSVAGILEELSSSHQVRLIARTSTEQWLSIFPEFGRVDLDLGRELAQRFDAAIVHVLVFDDDLFSFRQYRQGRLVSDFVTGVEVCDGDVSNQSADVCARSCRELLRTADECDLLREILEPRSATFESQRLEQVARVLQLPDVQVTYEELVEELEAESADKGALRHFPSLKSTAAKEQRVQSDLRSRGLLQGEIELKKDVVRPWVLLPESAVILLARGGTLSKYSIRQDREENTPLVFNSDIGGIWASPLGGAVIVYADGALHRISPADFRVAWSAPSAKPDAVAMSADAGLIAVAAQSEVTLIAGDGTIEKAIRCGHVRCLAIHPSGNHVVVASAGAAPTVSIQTRRSKRKAISFRIIDRIQQRARDEMVQEGRFAGQGPAGPAIAIVSQIEFSPDGTRLVCGVPGGLELLEWDAILGTPSEFPQSIAYCYPSPPCNERGSASYFWCAAIAVDWRESVFLMTGLESRIFRWRMGAKTIDELPAIPYRQRTARMCLAVPQGFLVCEYHDFPRETRKPGLLIWDYQALSGEQDIPS